MIVWTGRTNSVEPHPSPVAHKNPTGFGSPSASGDMGSSVFFMAEPAANWCLGALGSELHL